MKIDLLIFLLFLLPDQLFANGTIRWETLALTSSYTSVAGNTDFGVSVACHGVKGSETIALTGEKSVCLAKSDTAKILITADGMPADLIRFYWEQEFSANADAVLTINDTLVYTLKTDNLPDNSQLFEHQFSPQIALHKIQIRQSSASSGQISIGNIQIGSAPEAQPVAYRYGALVVSEMMIDPEPEVYLPGCEYIELANTTDTAIEISGFSVAVNGKSIGLPSYTLSGRSCVVLHGGYYGDTANFRTVSLPSLFNEGFDIAIYYANQLIYSAQYETHIFSSDVKYNGGWSLEKQSVSSFRNDDYAYSQDERGGSPGSVTFAPATDCPQVYIDNVYATAGHSLSITFSSQIDSTGFIAEEIKTNNQAATSIVWDAPLYQSLTAYFASEFAPSQKYELIIDEIATFCGNSSLDTHGYWSVTERPTLGDVVFNEILFDPATGSSEYIELINISNKAINLSELQLVSFHADNSLADIYPLTLWPETLFPDSIIAVSKDWDWYGQPSVCACPANLLVAYAFPALTNDGGKIGLYNRSLQVVDTLTYSPNMHSRHLTSTKGVSLQRTSAGWVSSPASCGYCSPGCANTDLADTASQYSEQLCPDYFSPNSGGAGDLLRISFTGEPNSTADVHIFSENGVLAVQLAKKILIAGHSQLYWDGSAEGENAPAGIYIIMVTLYNADGERKILKKPAVLLR